MLRLGPPQIVIDGVPCTESDCVSVGWVTMIGTGDTTLTIAAVAVAFTVVAVGPKKRISVVATLRDTVTRIRVTGSVVERVTPGAEAGKSTVTVSLAEPPNPFWLA